ncbi:hypothetical protein KDH_24100 [Dictyobacter sp. S3.2.2.5]|uniref:histidine kinase n=1 Tax=Dictyobacter halimunensis TaxID=3026934 RepID=A0ABQ6FS08_9CHLR|nr:hypothetical protein KDH_24100 [Dictyobacter sp. S3.2.2.5]
MEDHHIQPESGTPFDQKRDKRVHTCQPVQPAVSAESYVPASAINAQISTFELLMAEMEEAIILTGLDNKVHWLNKAATGLLELPSAEEAMGRPYGELFNQCRIYDLNHRPFSKNTETKAMQALLDPQTHKQTVLCLLPSSRIACIDIVRTFIRQQSQPTSIMYQLHDLTHFYEEQKSSCQNNSALLSLINAISHLRDLLAAPPSEESLSIPSSIHAIGQHLVDLIRDLLGGQAAFLFSLGATDQRLYYIAFSGLTQPQAELRWQNSGRYSLADFLDPDSIEQLRLHKQVRVDRKHMRIPFLKRVDFTAANLFWTPLFVKQELVGMFVLGRDNPCDAEESKLVEAVATLTALMIEYVRPFANANQEQGNDMVVQATNQIINTFLNLASHELKTPLTATMGNIQLALRRLERLKKQADLSDINKKIEQLRDPLEAASDSARLQERIIRNLIDDSRIQSDTFELDIQRCELLELVKETVEQHQERHPEQQFTLRLPPQALWVNVDVHRIKQVLQTYLTNASQQSPSDQPIVVQIRMEVDQAYISIHDRGPGIALEEQEHIWERLYRSLGTAPQNELDLSMGMSFYLCRNLVERHHGLVGVESIPGHGSTFWFSLPLARHDITRVTMPLVNIPPPPPSP